MKYNTNKTTGTQAELYVKERLWRSGYRVKDFSVLGYKNGFDLLVNESIRVEVKNSKCHFTKSTFFWNVHQVKPEEFDVLCVVLDVPLEGYQIYYLKDKKLLKEFCKNDKESNFSLFLSEARISLYFTKSPKIPISTCINTLDKSK